MVASDHLHPHPVVVHLAQDLRRVLPRRVVQGNQTDQLQRGITDPAPDRQGAIAPLREMLLQVAKDGHLDGIHVFLP
jgi:hypothetical protein